MRISIIIFLLIGSVSLQAQQYQNLQLEKGKNPDIDNMIFTPGRGFYYQVLIYESGSQKQLNFSDLEWTLQEFSAEKSISQVTYLTVSVKNSKRTNKRQTEVIIGYEPSGRIFQNTGIVENFQNIWLHPPRSLFFQILELCPFPYVKLASDSLEWKEQIKISEKWQDERWATWEDDLVLDLAYKNKGFKDIETSRGKIRSLITESKAKSAVGDAFLTTYFNSELGFVKMEYDILDKYIVLFELVEIEEFGEIKSPEDYLMKKRR